MSFSIREPCCCWEQKVFKQCAQRKMLQTGGGGKGVNRSLLDFPPLLYGKGGHSYIHSRMVSNAYSSPLTLLRVAALQLLSWQSQVEKRQLPMHIGVWLHACWLEAKGSGGAGTSTFVWGLIRKAVMGPFLCLLVFHLTSWGSTAYSSELGRCPAQPSFSEVASS